MDFKKWHKLLSVCSCVDNGHCTAGSLAAVKMRLQALKAAIKKTVSSAAPAAAVTREASREAAYAHGGGGYAFRQRKAAGALAEASAGKDVANCCMTGAERLCMKNAFTPDISLD